MTQEVVKKLPRSGTRADKSHNESAIRDAYVDLMTLNKGRKPTNVQLASATGLSITTVQRHLKGLCFKPKDDNFKILTNDVMLSVWRSAVLDRNMTAARLWFEIVHGYVPGASFSELDQIDDKVLIETIIIDTRDKLKEIHAEVIVMDDGKRNGKKHEDKISGNSGAAENRELDCQTENNC